MPLTSPPKWVQTSQLQDLTLLTKALADDTRLRILSLLQAQELCACQIVEIFELANSTISKHLAILRQAGLIQARKQGRWIYYFLTPEPSSELRSTFAWLYPLLANDPLICADQARIRAVLELDPVELCRRQNGKDCC